MSDSLRHHGLYSPWNSPGQNTGVEKYWIFFPFSRGSSQPRDRTHVSHTAGGFFTSWVTRKPKNTGVGNLCLLQGIFPTQESNRCLLHCRWILYQLNFQGALQIVLFHFMVGITADGDCSHEIKRCLLLGKKVMANLESILKCRDITLPTEIRLVKFMIFPVVMYGCESWTVKKAERQRIVAFKLWCWRRL